MASPEPQPTPPIAEPPAAPTPEVPIATPETSWRDVLPAEHRDHPTLTTLADVPALAKSYLHAQEKISQKGVVLPKPGDDEDRARFYNELGRPETADGYDLGDFRAPDGLPWQPELVSQMLPKLHALGLNQAQANGLIRAYAEMQSENFSASQSQMALGVETLKQTLAQEYGAAFPEKFELAKRALRSAAGDGYVDLAELKLADGSNLGDHPRFVRAFIKVGESVGEHIFHGSEEGGETSFSKTPEIAKKELDDLLMDKGWNEAWTDANHPGHKAAVERKRVLFEFAHPNQRTR